MVIEGDASAPTGTSVVEREFSLTWCTSSESCARDAKGTYDAIDVRRGYGVY